ELHDGAAIGRQVRRDLGFDDLGFDWLEPEPAAALGEPLEVIGEPADAPVARRHRLEHAVAVRDAAVRRVECRVTAAVDEPERFHGAVPQAFQRATAASGRLYDRTRRRGSRAASAAA